MSHPHNTPSIRAYAVVHHLGHQPTLTHDQARAAQIAASTHGVAHDLYTAPALLAHVDAMNTITPDPAGDCIGAIEHIGLCMTVARDTALATIRTGAMVADDAKPGTWWLDCSQLIDAAVHDADAVARHRRHIAIATFARWVVPHPTKLHHYAIHHHHPQPEATHHDAA